jgi:tRNA 2-thiouridine synthesizing protein A
MTKKALGNAASNDVIEILIDNPSSMEAIPPMLPELHATHIETIKGDRRWEVYIRKN